MSPTKFFEPKKADKSEIAALFTEDEGGSVSTAEEDDLDGIISGMGNMMTVSSPVLAATVLQTWVRKVLARSTPVKKVKSKNKGEKDEIKVKKLIFDLNKNNKYEQLVDIFGDEASEGVLLFEPGTGKEISDLDEISKASAYMKADCIFQLVKTGQQYPTSIKSKNGAPYTILNHTPRTANVFSEDGRLSHTVSSLDKIMDEYVTKRSTGGKEDVNVNDLEILNDTNIKEALFQVITYFLFDGTGSKDSDCSADAIMICERTAITFIKCSLAEERNEYIASLYDNLFISLRDKGMNRKISKDITICYPWLYSYNEGGDTKHKFALHIRVK
uniref:Uncharacterized protein n=1 Tax=viral metagenome TaxID=1070528 RepID=A0A6C0KDC9_9ZZZZ